MNTPLTILEEFGFSSYLIKKFQKGLNHPKKQGINELQLWIAKSLLKSPKIKSFQENYSN